MCVCVCVSAPLLFRVVINGFTVHTVCVCVCYNGTVSSEGVKRTGGWGEMAVAGREGIMCCVHHSLGFWLAVWVTTPRE